MKDQCLATNARSLSWAYPLREFTQSRLILSDPIAVEIVGRWQ